MHILLRTVFAIGITVVLAQPAIAQGRQGGPPSPSRDELLSAPTPRTEQGRPDLSGIWIGGVPGVQEGPYARSGRAFGFAGADTDSDEVGSTAQVRDGNFYWLEIDQEIIIKSDRERMPLYKPEYWEQVRWNEEYAYERPTDPGFGCQEKGIIKRGFPSEIIQLPNKVVLLYGSAPPAIRQVPTDGRSLNSEDDYEGLNQLGGSTVGRWEGDTLVVETVDFPDELVWYSTRGWPMSAATKITERFTRRGDVVTLETTVDDPAFMTPWEVSPIERRVNPNPNALFPLTAVCIDYDGNSVSGDRFGARFR